MAILWLIVVYLGIESARVEPIPGSWSKPKERVMAYVASNVLGRLAMLVEEAVAKSVDVQGNEAP